MSFTNGQAFIVTDEQTKLRWGGGFWCKLCGHKFTAGDRVRWIYANGTPNAGVGNFFVCSACDIGLNEDIIEKAKEGYAQAVKLAKQWGIYGPDWEREILAAERRARQ